jgi:uncharacterized protein YndB with AHSA1/START domain
MEKTKMQTLSYDIEIKASKQKVWEILWQKESYQAWTQFFSCSSTMQSDWKVGGKTYFYDAKGDGMISTIERLDEPNVIIFKHIGMIQNGHEDTESDEVKTWAGALEKYMLFDLDDCTQVHVEVDIQPEYIEMMNQGFERGLAIVKQLAEQ